MPSIEPLKAYGTGGLTPGGRLLTWDTEATDLTYSTLSVSVYNFLSKLYIYISLAP